MAKKRPRSSSSGHLVAGLAAAVVVFALVKGLSGSNFSRSATGPGTDIGIEHSEPLTVEFRFGVKQNAPSGLIEVTHDGTETVYVSLPDTWERREVRGRSLEDTPGEESEFGFVRWHIPQGATLSFRTAEMPRDLDMHNPSGIALKIRLVKVELMTGAVERNVILVKNAPVNVW
ncbi:hypothetical protein HYZ99_04940 [Candidatus Peregrinibacteria bacterium]|nr:hypothetical protein [Candidatus Peregrinibacteria bacterium]